MIHDYEYTLVFDLFESSDRGGAEIQQAVTFNVPFEAGPDVAHLIVEDIACKGFHVRDTKANRSLGSVQFTAHSLEADAWETTFKEMLATNAGLYSEVQRLCHGSVDDGIDTDRAWKDKHDRGAA